MVVETCKESCQFAIIVATYLCRFPSFLIIVQLYSLKDGACMSELKHNLLFLLSNAFGRIFRRAGNILQLLINFLTKFKFPLCYLHKTRRLLTQHFRKYFALEFSTEVFDKQKFEKRLTLLVSLKKSVLTVYFFHIDNLTNIRKYVILQLLQVYVFL